MLYFVDDPPETIRFYHSLLKNNGRLMIIIEKSKLILIYFIHFVCHIQMSNYMVLQNRIKLLDFY